MSAYLEVLFHGRHVAAPSGDVWPAAELDPEALRAELGARYGEEWTALVYAEAGESLLAITLTPRELHLAALPFDQQLRRTLERACLPRYRAYTYQDLPFLSGQRATPWADLAALGELLLPAEARARLSPDHRLLIVPGGPLHSLPWAALRLRDRWLVEEAIIQLIPGLQLWAELARRPRGGEEALLVGVSTFDGRAADLPSAIPSLGLAERHWAGPARRDGSACCTWPPTGSSWRAAGCWPT